MSEQKLEGALDNVIRIDDARIRDHSGEMVRGTVEEALIEMYLAGVSVRRVEDITEALWGTRISPGTASNLNKKIYAQIEAWRNRPIEGDHPYLYLDGPLLRKHHDEADPGLRGSQCFVTGGERDEFRRLPRDNGRLRGGKGR